MPAVLVETYPVEPRRKLWTRSECAAMEASGAWDQQHLELVEGVLIDKMAKNRPHVISLVAVLVWLQRVFGVDFVNPEAPIDVAPADNQSNEPEPDIIVLSRPSREIRAANPRPDELRLVVEISDSTLGFDLMTKAELYARAGIVEYWVFDVAGRRLIVHRDPQAGKYRSVIAYSGPEGIAPLSSPGHEFQVAEAFPD